MNLSARPEIECDHENEERVEHAVECEVARKHEIIRPAAQRRAARQVLVNAVIVRVGTRTDLSGFATNQAKPRQFKRISNYSAVCATLLGIHWCRIYVDN